MDRIPILLLTFAIWCQQLHQAFSLTYICNGHVVEQDLSSAPPRCRIMGDTPKSWEEGRDYCRSFGGALASLNVTNADIFHFNDMTTFWSGIFKQGHKYMQETPTSPIMHDVEKNPGLMYHPINSSFEECALYNLNLCISEYRKIGCKPEFLLDWSPCEVDMDFMCEIPAQPLRSLRIGNNKRFSVDAVLGHEMFFTRSAHTYREANTQCAAGGTRGHLFNISTPADRAILRFVADNLHTHLAQVDISDSEYQTSLFWVEDHDTPGCDALFLKAFDDQGFQSGHVTSWSCSSKLRVLCKVPSPVIRQDSGSLRTLKTTTSRIGLRTSQTSDRSQKSISPTVFISCRAEKLRVEMINTTYSLPDSPEGSVWASPETCARGNESLITTTCRRKENEELVWAPYKVNPLCNYSSLNESTSPKTRNLTSLSLKPITKANVAEVSEKLKTVIKTNKADNFTTEDVVLIADTMTRVSRLERDQLPPDTAQTILDSVSGVSRLPGHVLQKAQNFSDATNRILRTVDKLGVLLQLDANVTNKRIVSGGLGLEVWDIGKQSQDDPSVIGLKVKSDGKGEELETGQLVTQFEGTSRDYNDTKTAIYLPKEVLEKFTSGSAKADARLVMNVYKDTNLYDVSSSVKDRGSKLNRALNSRVIAAQLIVDGKQITELGDHRVVTVFEPLASDVSREGWSHKVSCAYWDFSSDLSNGHWSTAGCEHRSDENGRVVCECSHLTNFAVLIDYYDQSSLAHKETLGVITKIGLSLSIICLSFSIIAFLCIKKLRQGRPQQTLFQLSVSLVLSWFVFLVGIEQTTNYAGCVTVAAILHYLILTSFMWMLMEAVVLYLLVVTPFRKHISHYMLKMAIPSWGLPLLPVLIILAKDPSLYRGGPHYCWMSRHVLYYGFALPVGLILLTNLAIFIRICISLFTRTNMGQHSSMKKSQTAVNIKASFSSFFLLGITWIFGFLALEGARLVFQYLFCITASLQGFFIFLLFTTRDPLIRRYMLDNVCCCMKGWLKGESSGIIPTSSSSKSADPKGFTSRKAKLKRFFSGKAANVTLSTTVAGDQHTESKKQEEEELKREEEAETSLVLEHRKLEICTGGSEDVKSEKVETQASIS